MTQAISVVIPVYNGVTQLDFTGPHQFLSRTPDLNVRVASLGGEPITADLTFSNLEDLTVIKSCDVLLVPGGGGCINAIENDRFIKEIVRLGATARYLTSGSAPVRLFWALPDLSPDAVRPATGPGASFFRCSAPSSTRAAS
jgi:cyclohexyl-isocyanide hydratase